MKILKSYMKSYLEAGTRGFEKTFGLKMSVCVAEDKQTFLSFDEGLKLIDHLDVTQVYTSESPYFQRVTITDTFKDGNVAVSKGVNKVEDGKMWCIVHKPDKVVVHEGATEGSNTIIWSSNETSPQVIEYFQETVEAERYEIVGWGYYEGDDPKLSPRLWFYAEYERQ